MYCVVTRGLIYVAYLPSGYRQHTEHEAWTWTKPLRAGWETYPLNTMNLSNNKNNGEKVMCIFCGQNSILTYLLSHHTIHYYTIRWSNKYTNVNECLRYIKLVTYVCGNYVFGYFHAFVSTCRTAWFYTTVGLSLTISLLWQNVFRAMCL